MPGLGSVGWPELLACSVCGAALVGSVVLLFAVLRLLLK